VSDPPEDRDLRDPRPDRWRRVGVTSQEQTQVVSRMYSAPAAFMQVMRSAKSGGSGPVTRCAPPATACAPPLASDPLDTYAPRGPIRCGADGRPGRSRSRAEIASTSGSTAHAPVKLYWSATIYDRATHALIHNMSWSNRGSNTPGLQKHGRTTDERNRKPSWTGTRSRVAGRRGRTLSPASAIHFAACAK